MRKALLIAILTIVPIYVVFGQSNNNREVLERGNAMAVKTNLLYDALITPNIGVEFQWNTKWSVAANWMYAWWREDAEKWYHRTYGGDIELRRWIQPQKKKHNHTRKNTAHCHPKENNLMQGWHFGVYTQMLQYDFEWGKKGYLADEWSWGAGIAAGWSKAIGKNLNIDFTLGVGYLTGEYQEYLPIDDCYVWQATKMRHWIGPTKAEVQLVWLIKQW